MRLGSRERMVGIGMAAHDQLRTQALAQVEALEAFADTLIAPRIWDPR